MTIDTYSQEHRRACEARLVLTWSKGRRESFYQGVKEKRGQKAVDELISEVKKQYRLQLREAERDHSL